MNPELTLFEKLFPYIAAIVVGMAGGMLTEHYVMEKVVTAEKLAHSQDNARYAKQVGDMEAAAAAADAKALADHRAQEGRIETLDDQLTKEKTDHENDSRAYTAALADGSKRLRIAVTSCSHARSDNVPAAASAPGVDDGGATYADLDPATAGRVFTVAGDDQREIDKLAALQKYVCAIRPDLPQCGTQP
jgi:prophage endopeptidase